MFEQQLLDMEIELSFVLRASQGAQLSMVSNRNTGPGRLKVDILTEANV